MSEITKTPATFIKPEDLTHLEKNPDGTYKIPAGVEINIINYPPIEELEAKLTDLQAKLAEPEPSDAELIEYAKQFHPFYTDKPWIEKELEETNNIIKLLKS